jgi:hypothetical protein
MDAQHIEMARRAVALLRDAFTGEEVNTRPRLFKFITDSASSKDRAAQLVHRTGPEWRSGSTMRFVRSARSRRALCDFVGGTDPRREAVERTHSDGRSLSAAVAERPASGMPATMRSDMP